MWESICYSIFALAMLASIVLGFLVFARKKRSLRLFFWCALAFGFGVGFLGTGPKQGVVGIVMGLVFIVPSVCLMVMRARKLGQSPQYQGPAPITQTMPAQTIPVSTVIPNPPPQNAARSKSKPRKEWVDGMPLAYNYVLPFVPASLPAVDAEIEADVKSSEDTIEYWVDGVLAGTSQDKAKAEMVRDFIGKGESCIAYILPDRACVNLRFFRDRRKGQEWRKQTVVVPVNYKGNDQQEIISCLIEGQPLLLDDDEKPGTILFRGDPIGKLCAADIKRADEIGVYGLFVEEVEETEIVTDEYSMGTKTVYVPHIRIIWMDAAK